MLSCRELKHIMVVGCIAIALSACTPEPAVLASNGEAHTWIDAPLDGSRHPLAPVSIQTHASNPQGIVEFEYRLDGDLITIHDASAGANELAHDELLWEPDFAGSYLLQVRTRSAADDWGEAAGVRIDIGDPTPTFTVEPEETAPEPEPSPTSEVAVVLLPPTFTPPVFHFQGRDCPQQSAVIQIRVDPPGAVYNMILFLRFSDAASGYDSGWDSGHSMSAEGGGSYRYIITSAGLPDFSSDVNLIVRTQFVATGADGEQLVRSPVYTDLRLSTRCSE